MHDLQQKADTYPGLSNLIGAYFHQDYDIFGETPDEVVATFRAWNGPDHVQQTIQDCEAFLKKYGESDELLDSTFETIFKPEWAFADWHGRTTRQALLRTIEILST